MLFDIDINALDKIQDEYAKYEEYTTQIINFYTFKEDKVM